MLFTLLGYLTREQNITRTLRVKTQLGMANVLTARAKKGEMFVFNLCSVAPILIDSGCKSRRGKTKFSRSRVQDITSVQSPFLLSAFLLVKALNNSYKHPYLALSKYSIFSWFL